MSQTRRLAAILAADVAGYSRLIGADEGGTLRGLKTIQTELIDPKIAAHNGRLVKTTGDGFLAEFSSVVDALCCAVEIQREMAERNAVVAPDRRIEFRVGINVGDVVVENGDIFGDGVNVAARLEGLAEPGGICVSARVQEDVVGKLDLAFEDMGDRQLRNIVRPVRVYRVLIGELAAAIASPTASISQPAVAPRLSIVVLPFTNLSNDRDQQYFADGITEDVTTDLSRLAHMFVISRNTAFTYQNKQVPTKQIGRELGVRYVLEGSVRRSGDQVRVNAQLIDANTDVHLWAESFDGNTGGLFALQNEVTRRIAVSLNLELIDAEAGRQIERPDALDYILRGRAASYRPPSREKYAETISLNERALALDPRSVAAQSYLATALTARVLDNMTTTASADIARAELTGQALASSPRSPFAHFAKAQVLRAQRRPEQAISEYRTVITLNRNWVNALAAMSWCDLYTGSIERVIPELEQVIRLSPRDPFIGAWYNRIGAVHLLQSRFDEAIFWFTNARSANPLLSSIRANLASAHALKSETERAAAELAEARRLSSDDRYASIARLTAARYWGVPKIRALFKATYFAGLRKAGMPEE